MNTQTYISLHYKLLQNILQKQHNTSTLHIPQTSSTGYRKCAFKYFHKAALNLTFSCLSKGGKVSNVLTFLLLNTHFNCQNQCTVV